IGTTNSTDFPTVNPLQGTNGGGDDAFFTKIDAAGNFAYSTYLGTPATQTGNGIALDSSGNVFLCGLSTQVDADGDAYVVRLIKQGNGTYLLAGGYSLTFGGTLGDIANKVVADSSGNAYVVGTTNSTNFPLTAARFQGAKGDTNNALGDAWVAKLSPTAPQISISNGSLTEPNAGSANMAFTVSLDHPLSANVTVVANTANVTATAGSDYTALSNVTVTIPAMQTSVTLNVSITGDTTCESNETFNVNLTSPSSNATILDSQGVGTINDNDADVTGPTVTAPAAVTVAQSRCN
ncbi:MAG TPA: SBBP repeat-containing protein, partial [Thermoanaerobaculia bacterium]|nr:SBBP repeat-containing protein [Thermoanaerobaculia bacterium]